MANKSTIPTNQSSRARQSSERKHPQTKKKFYRYSDFEDKNLSAETEEYDDTKRKGQKEWDEEYREYDENDLGTDYGKP